MFEGRIVPSGAEILDAISNEKLALYVQPKVSIPSGKHEIVGGEALLRWVEGGSAVYSPVDIIHSAYKSGMTGQLNEFIFRKTAEIAQECCRDGLSIPISFNLSRCEFEDPDLPFRLAELLEKSGVLPSRLIVEITEESLFPDRDRALQVLETFREIGFSLSLDDFGSGYASVTDLYRLPLSEVKFDRSLIADIDCKVEARTVVRALAALMRELGLPICAEGVETQTALDFLRTTGCQTAQGYYFSGAVPVHSFIEMVKKAQ